MFDFEYHDGSFHALSWTPIGFGSNICIAKVPGSVGNGETKGNWKGAKNDVRASFEGQNTIGASIYDVRTGRGRGVPKKQTKGTKSADFCNKGDHRGGQKIPKFCGRHKWNPLARGNTGNTS